MSSELTALAYEAAVFPERWGTFLDAASVKASALGGTLFAIDHPVQFNLHSEALAPAWADFIAGGWAPRNTRAGRVLATGDFHFHHDDQFFSPAEKAADPWYTEFCAKWGLGGSLGTVIPLPSGGKLLLTLERAAVTGPYSDADIDAFNVIRADIGRSVLLASELVNKHYSSTTQMLQALGIAGAVVSSRRKLMSANGRFEALMPDLVRDRAGGVQLTSPVADRLLTEALERVEPALWEGATASFPLLTPGSPHPSIVHVIPVRGYAHDLITGGAAVIVIYTPRDGTAPSAAMIRQLFDLTAAEARVTSKLIEHNGNYREIAQSLGVSTETIKSQTKSVFSKMGVDGTPQLIHLVAGLGLPFEEN